MGSISRDWVVLFCSTVCSTVHHEQRQLCKDISENELGDGSDCLLPDNPRQQQVLGMKVGLGFNFIINRTDGCLCALNQRLITTVGVESRSLPTYIMRQPTSTFED